MAAEMLTIAIAAKVLLFIAPPVGVRFAAGAAANTTTLRLPETCSFRQSRGALG
jgi:hypothetical protein